jgi:hypothetical protein
VIVIKWIKVILSGSVRVLPGKGFYPHEKGFSPICGVELGDSGWEYVRVSWDSSLLICKDIRKNAFS